MKQHERTLPLTDPVLFRSRILVHGRRDAVSRRQDWLPRAKVKRSCNFFWFRSSTSNQRDTRYDAVLISFFFSLSQFSSFSFFLLSFIHISSPLISFLLFSFLLWDVKITSSLEYLPSSLHLSSFVQFFFLIFSPVADLKLNRPREKHFYGERFIHGDPQVIAHQAQRHALNYFHECLTSYAIYSSSSSSSFVVVVSSLCRDDCQYKALLFLIMTRTLDAR